MLSARQPSHMAPTGAGLCASRYGLHYAICCLKSFELLVSRCSLLQLTAIMSSLVDTFLAAQTMQAIPACADLPTFPLIELEMWSCCAGSFAKEHRGAEVAARAALQPATADAQDLFLATPLLRPRYRGRGSRLSSCGWLWSGCRGGQCLDLAGWLTSHCLTYV